MSLIIPNKKPQILYAPMLGTLGGGSIRSFGRGAGGSAGLTLAELYAAGTSAGLQDVNFNGTIYTLNYVSYGNKGWVEILFHGDVGEGHQLRSSFYQAVVVNGTTEYRMLSENTISGGTALDYTADFAQIMLGNDITVTDLAVTSKSSRSYADITASGENQGNALPLIASADLSSTVSNSSATGLNNGKAALFDFFTGIGGGVSGFYNTSSGSHSQRSYDMYWIKGVYNYKFAIVLYNREGGQQTDHWHIASSADAQGSTYYANIGYRGQPGSSWISRNVGAWDNTQHTAPPTAYQIDNSNVLSIWLTDM